MVDFIILLVYIHIRLAQLLNILLLFFQFSRQFKHNILQFLIPSFIRTINLNIFLRNICFLKPPATFILMRRLNWLNFRLRRSRDLLIRGSIAVLLKRFDVTIWAFIFVILRSLRFNIATVELFFLTFG